MKILTLQEYINEAKEEVVDQNAPETQDAVDEKKKKDDESEEEDDADKKKDGEEDAVDEKKGDCKCEKDSEDKCDACKEKVEEGAEVVDLDAKVTEFIATIAEALKVDATEATASIKAIVDAKGESAE